MFRILLMRGKFFVKLLKSILASCNGCETWWSCSWCQYEAIEHLTCSFGHVYHSMLNFVYLRSFRLKVLHFLLDSCIVNKGEKFELEMACWINLEDFQGFWANSRLCCTPVWSVEVTGLTGQSAGPIHMLHTVLTGGVDWSDRSELSWCSCSVFIEWFACIRPGGVAFVQGELGCVQVELFVVLELWIGGLCSLLEHCFVSYVSSRCPCLRGPRLVFFKWFCSLPLFGFQSLVGVSFCSFLFFFFSLLLL
jgi:hypothetical protein